MTNRAAEIEAILARKREIDSSKGGIGYGGGEGTFIKQQRWMTDAIELLLRIELLREHGEENK
jgi:hypothetical protein